MGINLGLAKPLAYDEIENVPSSTLSIVLEEQFGNSPFIYITNIICSGTVYAEFQLYIDNVKTAVKRSSPERNIEFVFPKNLYMEEGGNLKIKVIHYRADQLPRFECAVFGYN